MTQLKLSIGSDVRNLVFDFGGVLLDIDIARTIRAFEALHLTGLEQRQIHPDNSGVFLELELGQVDEETFVRRLQGYTALDQPIPTHQQLLDAWNALLLDYDWRRFELLDQLRASGYQVYLLSNTNLPHRRYFIEKFNRENPSGRPFESYFDRCFYSDAMGLRKPDPTIYRTLLTTVNLEAASTLFIDDNQPNTAAAAAVGMQAYHLLPPQTVFDLFTAR